MFLQSKLDLSEASALDTSALAEQQALHMQQQVENLEQQYDQLLEASERGRAGSCRPLA